MYGCENWSLTLSEEYRLRVFENGMLRRIFGPKMDGVTGDWKNYIMRSLINCTPQIEKNEIGGECGMYGGK